MRSIILTILFLIPLIAFASFPIENETTEIINKVSNINLDTKTLWYNTWWAILLNVIVMLIIPPLIIVGIPLLLRLIKGKKQEINFKYFENSFACVAYINSMGTF